MVLRASTREHTAFNLDASAAGADRVDRFGRPPAQIVEQAVVGRDLGPRSRVCGLPMRTAYSAERLPAEPSRTTPVSYARATSCARSRWSSLSSRCETWVLTVGSARVRCSAIFRVQRPCATSPRTSRSRSVSSGPRHRRGARRLGRKLWRTGPRRRAGSPTGPTARSRRPRSGWLLTKSAGVTSLRRKPLAPARYRLDDVFVSVERRRGRGTWIGQLGSPQR